MNTETYKYDSKNDVVFSEWREPEQNYLRLFAQAPRTMRIGIILLMVWMVYHLVDTICHGSQKDFSQAVGAIVIHLFWIGGMLKKGSNVCRITLALIDISGGALLFLVYLSNTALSSFNALVLVVLRWSSAFVYTWMFFTPTSNRWLKGKRLEWRQWKKKGKSMSDESKKRLYADLPMPRLGAFVGWITTCVIALLLIVAGRCVAHMLLGNGIRFRISIFDLVLSAIVGTLVFFKTRKEKGE